MSSQFRSTPEGRALPLWYPQRYNLDGNLEDIAPTTDFTCTRCQQRTRQFPPGEPRTRALRSGAKDSTIFANGIHFQNICKPIFKFLVCAFLTYFLQQTKKNSQTRKYFFNLQIKYNYLLIIHLARFFHLIAFIYKIFIPTFKMPVPSLLVAIDEEKESDQIAFLKLLINYNH